MNPCDICGSTKEVKVGRWIFYCPEHKQVDLDKTYANEIAPDLKSGDLSYILNDGELSDIVAEILG